MYSVDELFDDKKLVARVLQFQKKNRYSDKKMADAIGCSRQTYAKVRNGNGKVPASGEFLWKAMQFLCREVNDGSFSVNSRENNNGRRSSVVRETAETNISIELNIDGSGQWEINTGIGMFDHMLAQLARHGRFDIKLSATGDDQHHLVEDVAICLGQAFGKALGEKRGIVRMANVSVPMDDALATVAVDISGRGYANLDLSFTDVEREISGLEIDLIRHFLESFAIEARLNLHARVVYGINDHHKAEALFKALGRALDAATSIDHRISGELPSTKDLLEG